MTKKYLIRAGMLPFDNYNAHDLILNNTIASNVGNLLYQTAVVKTLMTDDDIQWDPISFPEWQIFDFDYINETYDCFVLPLANAFRISFISELNRITSFIKKLKIPCVVIGVGADGAVGAQVNVASKEKHIRPIQNFMNAVLEHSSIVGIRGTTTGDFLSSIGYKEDQDFTVIGCPSMFYHGDTLPDNTRGEFNYKSRISVSRKNATDPAFHRFMEKQMSLFEDHWFVPQTLPDYRLQYAAEPYATASNLNKDDPSDDYPTDWNDKIFMEDRVLCFLNQKTWMDFLSTCDFCFGSRIHGNIAGVISGTPSFIFASDSRILELAEYHNIPHMLASDVDETADLLQIYHEADFSSIYDGHKDRFHHYIDFLHRNNLETIYDEGMGFEECPFDKKFNAVEFNGPFHSFASCNDDEKMERIFSYYTILKGQGGQKVKLAREYIKEQKKKKPTPPPSFSRRVKRKVKSFIK